ncbi:olfactory receptor 6M1-like [Notechis scutatus]|uniref:Olfactory receptor n=1 Tax=Notechis scutatus TaxID=8663 RepID=A0A6J1W1D4_9SAUR|nr:olfactory receptor 6M1-like [Notechis scutatus]XP_026549147.1 olfactory receptor 6M1-like [Notechis scutatus]
MVMELSSPNITVVTEFILVSFQLSKTMECFLFWVFLLVFLLTLTGNLAIVALVCVDQRLQTPMYFFLCNLSLLETLFVLTICPKMLVTLISLNKTISFRECIAQCYFYFSLGTCECILIAVMAFDRYAAICYPLRYTIIMNKHFCVFLALGCWTGGFLLLLVPVPFLLHLSFCGSNLIDHFFCDYAPIIKLSCSKSVPFLLNFETAVSLAVMLTTLSINGVSYVYIISAVLRMHSTKGQKKTFSTCASHLTVASIFYGSSIFMYSLPTKGRSQGVQKAAALLTAVITPLLNPFIYTLRNQKVKEVLKDCLKTVISTLRRIVPISLL